MTVFGKLSLRLRITLLAGLILILSSVILTVTAAKNAGIQFANLTVNTAGSGLTMSEGLIINDAAVMTVPALTLVQAQKQFNLMSIVYLSAVLLIGVSSTYLIAGRSLRPIRRLSDTVAAITGANLRQRVPDENRHDEVGALGRSFNIMLDRLEEAFSAQKRFSANVAHELKTPLATMRAGIQVLRLEETPSVSDYENIMRTTERNLNRLIAVVDDLMTLCNEGADFETADVNLEDMLASVCEELRRVFEDKQLDVQVVCREKTVRANPELLYRACFNLIENAAKYNVPGGSISIESRADNGDTTLVISDTGGGIPEDELENIFEPFYRVNKSRSRKTGGAGLGLSIVRTIVDRHGWEITAESTAGAGSTFTVSCISRRTAAPVCVRAT